MPSQTLLHSVPEEILAGAFSGASGAQDAVTCALHFPPKLLLSQHPDVSRAARESCSSGEVIVVPKRHFNLGRNTDFVTVSLEGPAPPNTTVPLH